MKKFEVVLEPDAVLDIQDAIDYYDTKVSGLGAKFLNEIESCIQTLQKNPFFQIRYEMVRCLPVSRFPFMLHYTVDEQLQIVNIRAVIHTSLNPDEYWLLERED